MWGFKEDNNISSNNILPTRVANLAHTLVVYCLILKWVENLMSYQATFTLIVAADIVVFLKAPHVNIFF